MARLLAQGRVSARRRRRISRYFLRHAGDNLDETGKSGGPPRGSIAWLLWGGGAGRTWSEKAVRALDAEAGEKQSPRSGKAVELEPPLQLMKYGRASGGDHAARQSGEARHATALPPT